MRLLKILKMIWFLQVPDFTEILEKIYTAIEIILPYLVPFMNFVQPLVSSFGNFLRNLIAPFYSSLNLPADYYITRNFIPYYIIGGVILLFAIFAAIKWPKQMNIKKKDES
ncbi:MAG: hypothetical protein K9W44_11260 [Candidatus Lokiarchaeota archaeon]|nr:hypothetical protein [Candidatus Harpocratesius repetitus]